MSDHPDDAPSPAPAGSAPPGPQAATPPETLATDALKTVASGDLLPETALEEARRPPADPPGLPVVSPESYEVLGEFARGGMGRILRARDRRLGREVALKELHGEEARDAARFVREALVTARLQHPSIVPVYEAGQWPNGVPFYAMKLVSGRSLDAILRAAKTLPERLALLPHVIAVAEAVAYAHSERIVHRDLKPPNVLVGAFGETVVVDWGLAKDLAAGAADDAPAAPSLTAPTGTDKTVLGTVMGTPHFMPPEQARGEAVDERADVYALGAMLYYLLVGAPPHAGRTVDDVLAATKAGELDPVEAHEPDAPRELVAIVRKAMASRPADRYPSALELRADLKRFEAGQLVSVHRYSALDLARRFVRRHRAPLAVAAVLTLGLAASLVAGVLGIQRQARVAAEERDKARREAAKAEQINAFVQAMLGSADPRLGGKGTTVAQALEQASRKADSELKDQPEVQAAVQTTIGTTYQGLGLFEPAEAQLQAALEGRRRALGPEHRDVARSLSALAALRSDEGDYARAEALFRESLALLSKLDLAESEDARLAMSGVAIVLEQTGRLDEAERLHRETLALERRTLGPDSADVATSLHNLGVVMGQKGNWAEAERLHREAVEILRRVRPDAPELASGLSALASALEAQGNFPAAEAAFREAIASRRKLQGNEHPDTAWTLYNYAFFLRHKGDVAGAIRVSREVLALRGRVLPETHPMVSATLQVLGLALLDQGDARGALPLLRDSVALRHQSLPAGHWLIASGEGALGDCLAALGRDGEAEPLLLASYDSLRESRGESHERTVEARDRLFRFYERTAQPQKAARYRKPAG